MRTPLPIILLVAASVVLPRAQTRGSYEDLVRLFDEFLAFDPPRLREGAPDYTAAATASRRTQLRLFQSRLDAIDSRAWPVDRQVDYALVGAELSALDFNLRILRPWARDPAFYQQIWTEESDTPAHEGPTNHAIIDVWQYTFPLSPADEQKLATALKTIPPLLRQARLNLTGNAKDLWITGTATMNQQVADLEELARTVAQGGAGVRTAVADARAATAAFVAWLQQQAPLKNGPSGIGKANYTWNLQHAHLVPMTWEDEVALLKRELARAHASLKLEEQRNRGLPQLTAADSPAEYDRRANAAVTKYLAWLKSKDILTVQDYLDKALRERIGGFVPIERRNFFSIANHYEPMTLFAHSFHWFEHAWMKNLPNASPIRRAAKLYNVWMHRSEGTATAMEELILHAGYYDDNPRAREIVWIMLAQRCARGLASLYAQANEFDIKQAKDFQVEWTPRGWMRPDLDLLHFEQQLYLRQPGYGASYVTGKYLFDQLMKDRAHQLGDKFTVHGFFDEFIGAGMIPTALTNWQLTGQRP
ncbi:MAG TPA: DUF885 family protein [Vicinamibacterales bacterium]|nr:DUF885 family protein [Vicinamibacterales bacterium]